MAISIDQRRRTPLSRDRVLGAAMRIADREGIEALSMRRIGQALGVEAMALYNHVASKGEMLDGMTDLVVGEIDPPIEGADWKAALRARILSARQALLRHPWASAAIASRGQMTPTMMRYMESMGAILRNGGFSLELTHHAFHVLGSRILGFAQELYDDSEKLSETPEMMAIMAEQMADEFPVMTEIATSISHDEVNLIGKGCDDQFEFEFGLDIILDGLERARASEGSS
jgi:AcrR family transcriptional regulator